MNIITEVEAKSQGLTRFFTGKPCKRGHVTQRMVSGRYCCECKRIAENSNNNRRLYRTVRYLQDRTVILEKSKAAYQLSGPKVEYTQTWRAKNADRIKAYRKANAGLYAYHAACRRKLVRLATPPWVDKERIKEIYLEANRLTSKTNILHEVDHIIPIKHGLICGLHIPENLQIITALENKKKTNKFVPLLINGELQLP